MANYENYSRFWAPYDSRSQLGRHIEERFFAKLAEGRAARDAIGDEASLKARQDYVRKAFLDSLGMQPDEYPQPIDSFVTGDISYHIRNGRHHQTPLDWQHYLEIADHFFKTGDK